VGAHEWFRSAPSGNTAAAIGSGSPPVHRWMKKSLTRERAISARAAASVTDFGTSPTARAEAMCERDHVAMSEEDAPWASACRAP